MLECTCVVRIALPIRVGRILNISVNNKAYMSLLPFRKKWGYCLLQNNEKKSRGKKHTCHRNEHLHC